MQWLNSSIARLGLNRWQILIAGEIARDFQQMSGRQALTGVRQGDFGSIVRGQHQPVFSLAAHDGAGQCAGDRLQVAAECQFTDELVSGQAVDS